MQVKTRIDGFFEFFEHAFYIVVGFLLVGGALVLIFNILLLFLHFPSSSELILWVVEILDRILLMLMITEILYTVRLSIKDHTLHCEPFLIVGLIAAIRRILVISVETAYQPAKFQPFMIEISILGVLILIFVISIILLRKYTTAN